MFGEDRVDDAADGDLIADVGDVCGRPPPVGLDLGFHRGKLVLVTADDGDTGAQRGKLVRGAPPDAAATSGDHHGLTGEQSFFEH